MFDRIAPSYDTLNHLMSLGIDHLWRRRAVRELREFAPKRVLDLATGTCDLAIAIAKGIEGVKVKLYVYEKVFYVYSVAADSFRRYAFGSDCFQCGEEKNESDPLGDNQET